VAASSRRSSDQSRTPFCSATPLIGPHRRRGSVGVNFRGIRCSVGPMAGREWREWRKVLDPTALQILDPVSRPRCGELLYVFEQTQPLTPLTDHTFDQNVEHRQVAGVNRIVLVLRTSWYRHQPQQRQRPVAQAISCGHSSTAVSHSRGSTSTFELRWAWKRDTQLGGQAAA
jgi:hypothetical protein